MATEGAIHPQEADPWDAGATPPRRRWRSRARRRGNPIAVNLASMIDVTFLLLIFFLVTTTFDRPEGTLTSKLPRDSGAPAVALPISPIVVRVTQVGPGETDYAIRVDNFQNVPADFDELAESLAEIQRRPGFDADTPVVIIASDEVAWDHVVGAWNAAVRAGSKHIVFGRE